MEDKCVYTEIHGIVIRQYIITLIYFLISTCGQNFGIQRLTMIPTLAL